MVRSSLSAAQIAALPIARRRGRKPPPAGESRRDTFVRLANNRVPAAIDAISLIGNLANRKNYTFTAGDVEEIEAALMEAVRMTMAAFRTPKETVPGFRLDTRAELER